MYLVALQVHLLDGRESDDAIIFPGGKVLREMMIGRVCSDSN